MPAFPTIVPMIFAWMGSSSTSPIWMVRDMVP